MKHEISVIVPVYKVEQYLDRCVESILAQTFSDFELLLVDDGSPDRCPQMCDEWAQKDSRIRVIHKENGGPQDAVKHGVEAACGAYIAFADSDDWVEPEFLEILYRGITEHGADIVQCASQRVCGERKSLRRAKPQILDRQTLDSAFLRDMAHGKVRDLTNTRWDKLYRSSLLKKAVELCDTSIRMGEDFLMNFAAAAMADKIVILDTVPLYNYFFNEGSISGAYDPRHKHGKTAYYQNLERICDACCCQLGDREYMKNRRIAGYIYECAISDMSREEKKKEIREIVSMLDRKMWCSCIRTYNTPAKRICQLLAYIGMTDVMLCLVDVMKRRKGNP